MDFWDIYYDYYERVKRFIFALVKDGWVADDLVQETFIKVQKNLNQLRDDSKLSSWIFKIANNLCHDHFRKTSQSSKREQVLSAKKEFFQSLCFKKNSNNIKWENAFKTKSDYCRNRIKPFWFFLI